MVGAMALLEGGPRWTPNKETAKDLQPDQSPSLEDRPEEDLLSDERVETKSPKEDSSGSDSSEGRKRSKRRPRRPRRCTQAVNYADQTSSSSEPPSSNESAHEPSSDKESFQSAHSQQGSTDDQEEPDHRSQPESSEEDTPQPKRSPSPLNGGKRQLMDAQATDKSLKGCLTKAEKRQGGYFFKDGLICRLWTLPHKTDEVHQVVLPKSYRETTMKMAHFSPFAGHFGKRKTTSRIMAAFFWPGMWQDVQNMCRACETCQRMAGKTHRRYPLVPLPIIEKPFSRVAMDLVGPLPKTSQGHRFILVICDYATRYPEAIPLQTTTSEDIARAMTAVFARTGFPEEVLTDRGSNFCYELMKGIFKLMGARHIKTSAYHPETDRLVERFNGTLKKSLQKYVLTMRKDWQDSIPYILFAYREMPHSSTGHTPFELLYGRNPRGPSTSYTKSG